MTDLELLELAAMAIGEEFHSGHRTVNGQQFEWVEWNPLTDDGDALRLAVKLKVSIGYIWDGCDDQYDVVIAGKSSTEEPIGYHDGEQIDEDAATRRAIVRAAAELAKQQPSAEGDL